MTALLAYADRWSVRPGEDLSVMVSCAGATAYDAALVRVIQGDINPAGPGYREEIVALDLGGPFKGRIQVIHTGSYGIVDDNPVFAALGSFSLSMAIQPTTPEKGRQVLLARRDPVTGLGFALEIGAAGALTFAIETAAGKARITTKAGLLAGCWYAVAVSYNAASGRLCLLQKPRRADPKVDLPVAMTAESTPGLNQGGIAAALTIAAQRAEGQPAELFFNGRIDSPRLYGRALDLTALEARLTFGRPAREDPDLAADWDFSVAMGEECITDLSINRLHGRLVNLPTRGVTGWAWDGSAYDWKAKPEHYGAIHFHDDDLYDAGWEADFSITIPESLHSGVYAIRLAADSAEYYVPFCVRAPRGQPGEAVAFLLPTASYMAYANNRIGLDVPETELVCDALVELTAQDLYMQEHPELGLCFYDLHNDGSGVYYSSRLRPVMNVQPKFIGKLGGAGSNIWQFNADTHILGWLEAIGQAYDVITDEDLQQEGVDALAGYRAVITGSHPEYYSAKMLDALTHFSAAGGRLLYLGGNGFYWRVSFHPTLPGVIECRKSEDGIRAFAPGPGEYYASFTGEYTGLWRRNGRPPNLLAGVGMVAQGFDFSAPYLRQPDSYDPRAAFIFEGVADAVIGDFGLSGGGAAGIELDAADRALGTPPHALVLASSQRHSDIYLMAPEDMLDPAPGLGGTEAESVRSDLVFFETAKGGAVFSTGSIAWAGAMAWNGYDNHVARITGNVLRRFLDPAPL